MTDETNKPEQLPSVMDERGENLMTQKPHADSREDALWPNQMGEKRKESGNQQWDRAPHPVSIDLTKLRYASGIIHHNTKLIYDSDLTFEDFDDFKPQVAIITEACKEVLPVLDVLNKHDRFIVHLGNLAELQKFTARITEANADKPDEPITLEVRSFRPSKDDKNIYINVSLYRGEWLHLS